ncbi:MAG: hypothetical protein DWI64_05210 [Chloroflexi bacterium]|nr:MAG: hypothetical protein DWI64_05210 [Chloroflexota bacterium]
MWLQPALRVYSRGCNSGDRRRIKLMARTESCTACAKAAQMLNADNAMRATSQNPACRHSTAAGEH